MLQTKGPQFQVWGEGPVKKDKNLLLRGGTLQDRPQMWEMTSVSPMLAVFFLYTIKLNLYISYSKKINNNNKIEQL